MYTNRPAQQPSSSGVAPKVASAATDSRQDLTAARRGQENTVPKSLRHKFEPTAAGLDDIGRCGLAFPAILHHRLQGSKGQTFLDQSDHTSADHELLSTQTARPSAATATTSLERDSVREPSVTSPWAGRATGVGGYAKSGNSRSGAGLSNRRMERERDRRVERLERDRVERDKAREEKSQKVHERKNTPRMFTQMTNIQVRKFAHIRCHYFSVSLSPLPTHPPSLCDTLLSLPLFSSPPPLLLARRSHL